MRLVDLDSVEVARLLKQLHLPASAGLAITLLLTTRRFSSSLTMIMMMIRDERLMIVHDGAAGLVLNDGEEVSKSEGTLCCLRC